ncbi:MAG: hypothetical protein NPIRA01_03500 [Nitrospirales bacterium]|nr:MAG: hypothetical protein NPIRA01_03500 [Nitrospirales bacterium]
MIFFFILLQILTGGFSSLSWGNHDDQTTLSSPMVTIPHGEFIRGSGVGSGRPDERPQRNIYLHSYKIDTYEVSNKHYVQFLKSTGHKEPFNAFGKGPLSEQTGIEDLPVVQVTWNDAEDYCLWAGKRLPTEAEWEKAARGTDGRAFPWGDASPSSTLSVYDREWRAGGALLPVGTLPQGVSPYGVHNMSGNVREWVQDWYAKDYYAESPARDPIGPDHGILKVIRGGSWHSFEADIRASSRGKGGFALKTHGIGFRCAQDVSDNTKTMNREP